MSGVDFLPAPAASQPGASLPFEAEEAPEPPRRRRLGPHSLTRRLVAWVVTLVVVVVAIVGASTYFALRSFLNTRLDQQLQTTARGGPFLFQGASQNGPRPLDVWAVALDPSSGQVLDYPSGEGIVSLKLSASQRKEIAARQTADPMTITSTDGTELRITVRSGSVQYAGTFQKIPATVVIGLSTEDEGDTLSRLVRLEFLIGGAAVLVAIIATAYGVRFSLRRLRRVTTTAQEVAAELSPAGAGLDRRVPDDEPETEVGQLATSFNTMLGAVQTQFAARVESEDRMRQFLADASHELRTPLTSIRGYAELARMQRAVGDIAEDNLDRIESEGTRMSRLVEDLLLLARDESTGAHPPERMPLDVAELLDDVASGTRAAFPTREIDIETAPMPAVYGDHDQLLRVVRNLVTNACVHTDAQRPIRLRAYPEGAGATIQVIDGGPGLPPDEAAHVFERFWRADKARTRAKGGSGLGLSIVATVVRAHGGAVRFDSTVEGGSTATVWLPAAPPPAPAPPGHAG